MKQLLLAISITFISIAAFSQYKKASFFTKDGRIYELGMAASIFPDKNGAPATSVFYSNSLETEKKFSLAFELELMLKSKIQYSASYYDNNTSSNVQGMVYVNRSSSMLVKYGGQYRFVNTEKEDSKLEPYIKGMIFYGMRFKDFITTDKNGNEISATPSPSGSMNIYGAEAGAGITYYFADKFGIRVGGFYRYAISADAITGTSYETYNMFKSHPGFSVSLKYRVFSE